MEVSITFSVKPEIVREWYPVKTQNKEQKSKSKLKEPVCSLDKTDSAKELVNIVKMVVSSGANEEDSKNINSCIDSLYNIYVGNNRNTDDRKEKSLEEVVESILEEEVTKEYNTETDKETDSFERVKNSINNIFKGAKLYSSDNKKCFNKLISVIHSDAFFEEFVQKQDPKQVKELYDLVMTSIKKYCGTEKEYREYERIFGCFFEQDILNPNMAGEMFMKSIPGIVNTFGSMIEQYPGSSSSSSSKNAKPFKKDADVPPFSE